MGLAPTRVACASPGSSSAGRDSDSTGRRRYGCPSPRGDPRPGPQPASAPAWPSDTRRSRGRRRQQAVLACHRTAGRAPARRSVPRHTPPGWRCHRPATSPGDPRRRPECGFGCSSTEATKLSVTPLWRIRGNCYRLPAAAHAAGLERRARPVLSPADGAPDPVIRVADPRRVLGRQTVPPRQVRPHVGAVLIADHVVRESPEHGPVARASGAGIVIAFRSGQVPVPEEGSDLHACARAPGRRAARVTYILPRSDTSARWARYLTAAYLEHGCGEDIPLDQVDDATLVVSELVTNATRHGRSSCRLQLSVRRGEVTVTVHDNSPQRPRLQPQETLAEDGRGIAMVRELSQRFSVLGGPGRGKTVQAVLAGC